MSTTADTSARVFISYSHRSAEEVELARTLREALATRGHTAFIDTRMTIGTDWSEEIFEQIQASDFFIVLLSERSARSEMVQTEVRIARDARREDGRPVILPVRIRFSGQLDYELDSILRRIQYASWNEPDDTDRVLEEILTAIVSESAAETKTSPPPVVPVPTIDVARPTPSADKRPLRDQRGALPEDDPHYIKRPQDEVVQEIAALERTTVIIRAPSQMGKSSLLRRYLAECRRQGKRVAQADLGALTGAELTSYAVFLRSVAESLLHPLGIEADVSKINRTLSMTYFVEDVLLANSDTQLVIAIDEADKTLETPWKHDFFSMLRVWHNRREEMGSRLKRLDIALAIATDPFLLIEDANQSPFSVGTLLTLESFNEAQVAELNAHYGSRLNPAQCAKLWELFQGQPYLTRLLLYRLQSRDAMTFDDLIAHAPDIDGPFGEHLRSKLLLLQRQPELIAALRSVLRGEKLNNEIVFDRLHAAGLVIRERGVTKPANLVYAQFFRQQ